MRDAHVLDAAQGAPVARLAGSRALLVVAILIAALASSPVVAQRDAGRRRPAQQEDADARAATAARAAKLDKRARALLPTDRGQAIDLWKRAAQAYGQARNQMAQGQVEYVLGAVAHEDGDRAAAVEHLEAARELLASRNRSLHRAFAENRLLAIGHAEGDVDLQEAYERAVAAEEAVGATPFASMRAGYNTVHCTTGYDSALAFFMATLDVERPLGGSELRCGRLEIACAYGYYGLRKYDECLVHLARAIEVVEAAEPAEQVRWFHVAATLGWRDPDRALRHAERAVELASSLDDVSLLSREQALLAGRLEILKRTDEAVREWQAAVATARTAAQADPRQGAILASHCTRLGALESTAGNFAAARDAYQEAADAYRATGEDGQAAVQLLSVARTHVREGDLEAAEPVTQEYLDYQRGRETPAAAIAGLTAAGKLYLAVPDECADEALALAKEHFDEAIEIRRAEDDPKLCQGIIAVAEACSTAGCHSQAVDYYGRARLAAAERGDRQSEADALAGTALALATQGAYPAALAVGDEVVAILGELGRDAEVATWLLRTASYERNATLDFSRGVERYRRAAAIYDALGEDAQTASTCYSLGFIHERYLDDLGEAAALYRRSAEKYMASRSASSQRQAAKVVQRLAGIHHGLGDDAAAARAMEELLASQEANSATPYELATTQRYLASYRAARGDYEAAIECAQLVRELHAQSNGGPATGDAAALLLIAELHHLAGRHGAAEAVYREALAEYGGEGSSPNIRAFIYGGLAHVLLRLDRPKEARAAYRDALIYERSSLSRLERVLAMTCTVRGPGDHARALGFYERALEVEDAFGNGSNLRTASALRNTAAIREEQGETEHALALYEQAAAIYRDNAWAQELARILEAVGLAREALGEWEAAVVAYDEALDLYRELDQSERRADLAFVVSGLYAKNGDDAKAAEYRSIADERPAWER